MKILFFGNSHVGAFKKGFDLLSENCQASAREKEIYNFYAQNEVRFISILGLNWRKVSIGDSSTIGIPGKTYIHVNGVRTDTVINSYEFNSFNTLDYDVIAFCRGDNIVDYCNSYIGEVNPPLLTSSLVRILLKYLLRRDKEFKKIISSNAKSQFIYVGSPVRFLESIGEWENNNGNAMLQTRSRNLSFLRENICGKSSYDLLVPPPHCIDSAGRFSFDRYGRSPVQDKFHANGYYGIEMLGELKSVIQK